MPRRDDIESILILGSGPIVIGQACEFDYSGTQACRVLREEGYRVILANSNPATIMTDPDFADATYVEPLVPGGARAHPRRGAAGRRAADPRRADRAQPGDGPVQLGGPRRRGIELIGAKAGPIDTAEDRDLFKRGHGRDRPRHAPQRHRPRHGRGPRGGRGARPAGRDPARLHPGRAGAPASPPPPRSSSRSWPGGLDASPITEILIEKSIAGWKEYELEVMRDRADNCVIICSIENLDPMGVHTGDSITVAPAQTLTDVEYQADARRGLRRACGGWGWRPAARTSSSPSTRDTAGRSSSR